MDEVSGLIEGPGVRPPHGQRFSVVSSRSNGQHRVSGILHGQTGSIHGHIWVVAERRG